MFLYNKLFNSTQTISTSTQTTSNKLFLLYGAKNTRGIESSYLIGVFDNENLAIIEKDLLDNELNLTWVGKTIYNKQIGSPEYIYKHYIIECILNKNYKKNIEDI